MNVSKFHARALEWLRTERCLLVAHGVGAPGAPARAGARVHGHFVAPSTAGHWAFAGLCALAFGAILTMLDPPGVSDEVQQAIGRVGYVAQGAGFTCLVTAEAKRRRSRVPAVVELRSRAMPPATPESIVALSDASRGAETWIVTEHGLSPEALATAAERGVRCFVRRGGRFDEDDGSTTPPPRRRRA